LVSLRPEVEGFVVPSKFYGIAAAGRPTLFIGDQDGEIARIVRESQCGITVGEGDVAGLQSGISRLRTDASLYKRYCENARRTFETRFEKQIALAAWNALLAS
jgi:glycosyltransferase involved in cell wall biosynthesis